MIHNNYENHYSYDSFNRLSIEDNQIMDKSFSYGYDNNGNLTMVKEGSYNLNDYKVKQRFAYNNFNQLTKVVYSDGSYDEITSYDSYGNPHLIKKMKYCLSGSCCTSENIVLSYGRNNMLERYGDNYYYYNEEGIRIAKEENGLIHKYYVEDNVIHKEEIRNKSSNQLVKEIYYYYDETGISAFRINSNIYYYLKDLTGLILGIYNSDGVIVARYVYDAFGNHKVYDGSYNANTNDSFIGNINPFRYKSYYYDKESNLYYLNSRYYSPIYYRFISIDDIDYLKSESINGINLYTYCGNDPINYTDGSGHMPKWAQWLIGGALIVGAIALTICTAGVGGALSIAMGGGFWATVGSGALVGAVVGAASGALMSAGTQIIANGFEDFSWSEVGKSALIGGLAGGIAGGLFAGIQYGLSAGKIANSVSGLSKAQTRLDQVFKPLRNIKNLSNMPFSGTNIARTIGQGAGSYNNAYSAYILAKGTYDVVNATAKVLYFVLENLTSDLIGLMF